MSSTYTPRNRHVVNVAITFDKPIDGEAFHTFLNAHLRSIEFTSAQGDGWTTAKVSEFQAEMAR